MKRILSLLTALALLCGCAAPESVSDPPDTEPEPVSITDAVFYVDTQLDERFYTAAVLFAERLEQLSDEQIKTRVLSGTGLAGALAEGAVQFTFLDSRLHRDLCSSFDAVSAPFLYTGYLSFSMAANSERALNLLYDDMGPNLGMRPVAALLQEPVHLVTEWPVGTPTDFADAVIAMREDRDITARMLELLEAEPVEAADSAERITRLMAGEFHGAEFSLSELSGLHWSDSELFLTLTWHELDPVWMTVDEQFLQSLDPSAEAALREALTWLYQDTDQPLLEDQQRLMERLESQGVIVLDDFSAERDRIFRQARQQTPELLSDALEYMLSIVRQINQ